MEPSTFARDSFGTWAGLAERKFGSVPGKAFLRGNLGLTGCEISVNRLPAGRGMPFLHDHRRNEEVYLVVGGEGTFHVDGSEFPLSEGSVVRVAPGAARGIAAGSRDLDYVCVQVRAGTMDTATIEDGFRRDGAASWMP
jgi:mannose-6-phosphate isomerase-like protein (cupin superfamily)